MSRLRCVELFLVVLNVVTGTFVGAEPPAGFTSLFNGRDLAGWRGRPHLDPRQETHGAPMHVRNVFIKAP